MSYTVLYWLASIALVVTSACSGSDAQDNATFTVHLTEYRVIGPSTEVMDSFEQSKEQTLEALRGTEPRLRVAVDAEPGVSVAIDEPPAVGTARIETADEGRVEVTLDVDRFFSGTPLLIERCSPFVLTRSRVRVQNQAQVTLRAVEVRDGSCPGRT